MKVNLLTHPRHNAWLGCVIVDFFAHKSSSTPSAQLKLLRVPRLQQYRVDHRLLLQQHVRDEIIECE